ncbi:MAG: PLP-dependent aminotransferase family protein [Kofleriaceae bacterium]
MPGDFLYEQLAAELGDAIERGALRPGARLPSVRRLAEDRDLSVATVVAAYARLEGTGLIEARPKSGYFVRRRQDEGAPPRPPRRSLTATRPAVSDGIARLITALRDPTAVPLAAAYLDPSTLKVAALNRIAAALAREVSTLGAKDDTPPGLVTLRRVLARRSVSWGAPLTEDDFVATIGATEAITLALRAVTRAGDTVVVESPTYFGILQTIEALDLRVVEVPAHPRTGIDLAALDDALTATPIRAIVTMPTAANPLGSIMPDEAKAELYRLAVRHDVPIIEDDVYGELCFDGTRPRPLKAFDRDGRVLLCGSVSKTLAPGYRVGWIVPGRYQDAVERLKFSQSLACPTLPGMAVAEMLASGGYDRHLRRLRHVVAGQVARYRDEVVARFPDGTRVSAPRGGFVLWVELPGAVDTLVLQEHALARGVAIAPGPIFSARQQRFSACLRLSCGQPFTPRVAAALDLLAHLAEDGAARGPRAHRATA